jgi:hypothetical protein
VILSPSTTTISRFRRGNMASYRVVIQKNGSEHATVDVAGDVAAMIFVGCERDPDVVEATITNEAGSPVRLDSANGALVHPDGTADPVDLETVLTAAAVESDD